MKLEEEAGCGGQLGEKQSPSVSMAPQIPRATEIDSSPLGSSAFRSHLNTSSHGP